MNRLLPLLLLLPSAAFGSELCLSIYQSGTYIGSGLSLISGTYLAQVSGSVLTLQFRFGSFRFSGVKQIPCNPTPSVLPANSILSTFGTTTPVTVTFTCTLAVPCPVPVVFPAGRGRPIGPLSAWTNCPTGAPGCWWGVEGGAN